MKRKIIMIVSIAVAVASVCAAAWGIFAAPVIHEKECKERVFTDMQERSDVVRSSVIGILPKTVSGSAVTYGHGGSGVVFEKDGKTYYALTAAHVVDDPKAEYKAYTDKTELSTINSPETERLSKLGFDIVDSGFYNRLSDVKTEYVSPKADIAVVSFECEDELVSAELGESEPKIGDRLVCMGHPGGEKSLILTYGSVTSGLHSVTLTNKRTGEMKSDLVYNHDAYINDGNSGGAAFNDSMKLEGINIGGSFNFMQHFDSGCMISCGQLRECIAEWRAQKK